MIIFDEQILSYIGILEKQTKQSLLCLLQTEKKSFSFFNCFLSSLTWSKEIYANQCIESYVYFCGYIFVKISSFCSEQIFYETAVNLSLLFFFSFKGNFFLELLTRFVGFSDFCLQTHSLEFWEHSYWNDNLKCWPCCLFY